MKYLIFPVAFLSMITGVYCGLIRVGWPFAVAPYLPVSQHGLIMTGPFLGTLIALERVVVLKKAWTLSIPVLMAASLICLVLGFNQAATWLLMAGGTGYVFISFRNYLTYKLRGDILMAIGSVFQLVAFVVFHLTHSYPRAFAGWLLFFVLTITGERLNLTRFLPVSKKEVRELFFWVILLLVSSFLFHFGLAFVVSLSMIGIAQWLIRKDIVFTNLKKSGHFKFLGFSLLMAYIWLIVTAIVSSFKTGNPWLYDAVLHAFFIGFVLNMILAHAPIIFPALIGIRQTPYHPLMYIWSCLLQMSLIMRVYGDLVMIYEVRKLGSLLNAASFLAYLLTIFCLIVLKKKP